MALGARIKLVRQKRGWTQTVLAERVTKMLPAGQELSQQALDRLEKRDSNKSEYVIKIADALGVSVRWLMDGEGDMDTLDRPTGGTPNPTGEAPNPG